MQIESAMRCLYYTPNKMAKIWKTGNTKYWQVCGETHFHTLLKGMQNGIANSEGSLTVSYKTKCTLTI